MSDRGVLFVSYRDTVALLSVADSMAICEQVYLMHARGSVVSSDPSALRLSEDESHHNHWQVKAVLLKDLPATGVRFSNYYADGVRDENSALHSTRYVALSDPNSGAPLAIVDEHWNYGLRSGASAAVACKWLAVKNPKILGLVGVGHMGTNSLRCLASLYSFDEIRCTSRRPETRNMFADKWAKELGVPVVPMNCVADVVQGSDIVVGGTSSAEILVDEPLLKPGCTFVMLSRYDLDPAGWGRMDKVVVDSWEVNMSIPNFSQMVEAGQFSELQLYAEIHEIVSGSKKGRESEHERILIRAAGLVSQDVALAHFVYQRAREKGLGVWLPATQ